MSYIYTLVPVLFIWWTLVILQAYCAYVLYLSQLKCMMDSCIYGALINAEQAEMKIMYFYCQSDVDAHEESNKNPISNSLRKSPWWHFSALLNLQVSGFVWSGEWWRREVGERSERDTVFLTEENLVGFPKWNIIFPSVTMKCRCENWIRNNNFLVTSSVSGKASQEREVPFGFDVDVKYMKEICFPFVACIFM